MAIDGGGNCEGSDSVYGDRPRSYDPYDQWVNPIPPAERLGFDVAPEIVDDTGDDLDVLDFDGITEVAPTTRNLFEFPDDFFTAPDIVDDGFDTGDDLDVDLPFEPPVRNVSGGGSREWWNDAIVEEQPVVTQPEYPLDVPTGIVDDPHESRELQYDVTPEEMNIWVDQNTIESRELIRQAFESGRFTPHPQMNINCWVKTTTDATELAVGLSFQHGYQIDETSNQALQLVEMNTPLSIQAVYYAATNSRMPKQDEIDVLIKHDSVNSDAIIHKAVRMGHRLSKDDVNELCTHGNRQANGAILAAMKAGNITLNQSHLDVIAASTPTPHAGQSVDSLVTEITHLAISNMDRGISM